MASSNLYISDIPKEYHFARFGSNYVDLFNVSSAQNTTLNCYRIYYDIAPDFYIQRQESFGNYNTTFFTEIGVTDSVLARNDIDSVFTCVFIAVLAFVFLTNLFTSIFKKGGLLGGLL